MIEFEIKIPADIEKVRSRLNKHNANFINKDFNKDSYYNHPNRDFNITDEALRIRETGSGYQLTYKGPKFDLNSKSRKEININSEKEMHEILILLGFKLSDMVVKKKRETWEIENIIITLDDVENLGTFVELEIEGENEDQKNKMLAKLREMARKLNINPNDHIRRSYLELLKNKK